jgi:hypothetical protein
MVFDCIYIYIYIDTKYVCIYMAGFLNDADRSAYTWNCSLATVSIIRKKFLLTV